MPSDSFNTLRNEAAGAGADKQVELRHLVFGELSYPSCSSIAVAYEPSAPGLAGHQRAAHAAGRRGATRNAPSGEVACPVCAATFRLSSDRSTGVNAAATSQTAA